RPAEPAGLIRRHRGRERAEHHYADGQRHGGPAHDPRRDPAPQAGLAGTRAGLARPEGRPAEHREQRGQQGEAGQQHGADADGQRDGELGVDLEGGGEQREQRGDDGQGGESDGLTYPHDRRAHRVLRIRPLTQVLTDAEDQEQPIVGARAEDQHYQHQLGQLGDLQASVRRLGDQRPRDSHGEERRDQRDQRREQRPEDQQQQDQDEQDGHDFDLIPRGARLGLLVDVDRDVTGQVHLQPRRRIGLLDRRAQVVHQRGLPSLVAAADVGQDLKLLGLAVGRPAQVAHRDNGRYRAEILLQLGQPGDVLSGEGALADRRDDGDRDQVVRPERGRELRRLLTGSAGGQKGTVVALSDAVQRWQEVWYGECRDQPGRDDDPAEFDGERADSPEDGVDAHPDSLLRSLGGATPPNPPAPLGGQPPRTPLDIGEGQC